MESASPRGPTTPPDPRPRVTVGDDGAVRVVGWRCPACGYAGSGATPHCPRCRSEVEEARFGPAGTVWSSTVLHVALPGREPPYALVYVDVDDGPRLLAHLHGPPRRLPAGTRVGFDEPSAQGDLVVREVVRE